MHSSTSLGISPIPGAVISFLSLICNYLLASHYQVWNSVQQKLYFCHSQRRLLIKHTNIFAMLNVQRTTKSGNTEVLSSQKVYQATAHILCYMTQKCKQQFYYHKPFTRNQLYKHTETNGDIKRSNLDFLFAILKNTALQTFSSLN